MKLEKENMYRKQNVILAQEAFNEETLSTYIENSSHATELNLDQASNLLNILKRLYCDVKTPFSEW